VLFSAFLTPSTTVTTRREKRKSPANDLVKRQFRASGPNQLWVADMTYVPTWTGFLYLAVVIDVWNRRVVGWSMVERMTADMVLSALNMALTQRKSPRHQPTPTPTPERAAVCDVSSAINQTSVLLA
jgi:transposase InsO family protein